MRSPIAIAAVVALTAIAAEASAQSRYGPPPTPSPADQTMADLPPGALLNWRGKPPPQTQSQAARQTQAPVRPEPVAPWAQRMASLTPPPARPLPEPLGPAIVQDPEPVEAQRPRSFVSGIMDALPPLRREPERPSRQPAPPPAPLPTSLYDPPAPASRPAQQRAAPQLAARPPAPQPMAAPAARPAAPPTALLGEPRVTQAGPPAIDPASLPPPNQGPRFYSVFREYGVTPDQIPLAPNAGRADEVQLRDIPQTPSLSSPDDTQYIPPRTNQSDSAANRTF